MPRRSSKRKTAKKRSRSKQKRKRKIKRKHKTDKLTHAKRRHARSHRHVHKARMVREVQTVNSLLSQLLKTAAPTETGADPYHYDKGHYTKDPEYQWSDPATKKFKQGFPAPDVNFWRSQGPDLPTYRGNYPNWRGAQEEQQQQRRLVGRRPGRMT